MTSNPVAQYIEYLQKVVGIKSVLSSESSTGPMQELPSLSVPARFLFVDDKTWSAAANELFSKMRQAMNLTDVQFEVMFRDQISAADLQVHALGFAAVIDFSAGPGFQSTDQNIYQTISPELLLTQANLKKQAWDDLKKVMKDFDL